MKVLLLKDVYKLGHAGDIKKVADGYARNFLIPQRLATLATASAIKQAETLRQNAAVARAQLNTELGGVADTLRGLTLAFPVKAGETGKLYGSVTPAMIADAIKAASGLEIDRRNVGHHPLRELGEYKVQVRLTSDLLPEVKVILHREGETLKAATARAAAEAAAAAALEAAPARPEPDEAEAEAEPAEVEEAAGE